MSDVALTSLPPTQAGLVRSLRALARIVADQTPPVILDVRPVREDATRWCCGVTAPVLLTPRGFRSSHLCVKCACDVIRMAEARHITAEVRIPAGRWGATPEVRRGAL